MFKLTPGMLRLFFGALLACLPCAAAQAAPDAGKLTEQQERIDVARQRIADVRSELSGEQKALRDAEQAAARISHQLREIRRRLQATTRERDALQKESLRLERELAAQREALARDVRDAWMLHRQPPAQRWLGTADPQLAARLARYYDYLHRERARRLEEYRNAQQAAGDVARRLQTEEIRLRETQDTLAAQERELQTAREERRRLVSRLSGELKDERSRLKRLEDDAAALRRLAARAREAFRDLPPESVGAPLAKRRGKLRWPVAGRLVQRFGAPVAQGTLRSNGVVIAAREGAEVRAVHGGRVVFAEWMRGYGLLAIVDHGDGYLSIYGHNQALTRQSGDMLREGDVLATVGNSGGQAQAGLYFELRQHGEPQDPLPWFRR